MVGCAFIGGWLFTDTTYDPDMFNSLYKEVDCDITDDKIMDSVNHYGAAVLIMLIYV